MSKNNQREKEMTITDLAQEMREGFKEMRAEFKRVNQRVDQGFEVLSLKIDTVEEEARAFRTETMAQFKDLEKGLFTEEEKEQVMVMARHYDHWLEDDTLGTKRITLTREEYDAASFARGFRNRFDNLKAIMVE
jgi:hypothetical protein